jgi:hypothetical protein
MSIHHSSHTTEFCYPFNPRYGEWSNFRDSLWMQVLESSIKILVLIDPVLIQIGTCGWYGLCLFAFLSAHSFITYYTFVSFVRMDDLNVILGPIVLAVVANVRLSAFHIYPFSYAIYQAAMYGAGVVQFYTYFTSKYKDTWYTRYVQRITALVISNSLHIIRLLVFWVMILDTVHTASTVYMLWQFTVPNFGNLKVFSSVPWPFPATPIFSTF